MNEADLASIMDTMEDEESLKIFRILPKAMAADVFADLEFDAWKIADGWIYWSYKLYPDGQYSGDSAWKESWDFRHCIENRWMKIR